MWRAIAGRRLAPGPIGDRRRLGQAAQLAMARIQQLGKGDTALAPIVDAYQRALVPKADALLASAQGDGGADLEDMLKDEERLPHDG